MRYKILSEIRQNFRGEEGTEGVRVAMLSALEAALRQAYIKSDKARDFAREKQVAPDSHGQGRVKALAKFHEGQQAKEIAVAPLNEIIVKYRQWLFRQKAILTVDGKIIWPKSHRTVVYDHQLAQQNLTRLKIANGLLNTPDGKRFDTKNMVTHFSGPGCAIYVMSQEGNFHVDSHSVGHRHHSSLLAGGLVAGAGELKVDKGRIMYLSNKSGHYTPDAFQMLQTLHALREQGVPFTFRISFWDQRHKTTDYNSVDAFMMGQHFDNQSLEEISQAARAAPNAELAGPSSYSVYIR